MPVKLQWDNTFWLSGRQDQKVLTGGFVDEGMRNRLSPIASESINWYWQFLTKWQMYKPSDPAVPLLGIYPTATFAWGDLFKLLIPALFVKENARKQPKCPSGGNRLNYETSIQWNTVFLQDKNEDVLYVLIWKNPQVILLSCFFFLKKQ